MASAKRRIPPRGGRVDAGRHRGAPDARARERRRGRRHPAYDRRVARDRRAGRERVAHVVQVVVARCWPTRCRTCSRARTLRGAGGRCRRGGSPASARACAAVLAVAVSPPVDAAADRRLSAHMAEHLAIGDLAPLLLVLGLTGPLLAPLLRSPGRRAAARRSRTRWSPSRCGRRTCTCGTCGSAYEAAVDHDARPRARSTRASSPFGANLWLALLGPLPKPAWFGNGARLGYVLAVGSPATTLAYAFVLAGQAFYPHYAAMRRPRTRRCRPERRRRGDAGRAERRDGRRCSRGCWRARCATPGSARSWPSSRRRAASRWTSGGSRARSPPSGRVAGPPR